MQDFFVQPDAPQAKVYTVTEFNSEVNTLLGNFQAVIQGEISGYKVIKEKFVSFDLKDGSSVLPCFLGLWQLNVQVEDGMEVKIGGRPGLYVPSGRYTFRVNWIEPVGAGALKRAFELTRAKLEKEGLFDPKFKKPLPRFPQTLGLITSTDAAAYTDVLKILNNRWGGLEIRVNSVLVQGAESPGQIVRALEYFNQHEPVDVIILTRGGGSLEDLQAFNSEAVCRAVFASKIPVICGVGHERDISLAELVADRRASTPTNAAQLAVPDRAEILAELSHFIFRLESDTLSSLANRRAAINNHLDRLNSIILGNINLYQETKHRLYLAFQRFNQRLTDYGKELRSLNQAFSTSWRSIFEAASHNLSARAVLLESLNPMRVLGRGYSVTYGPDGKILRSAGKVQEGQFLKTRLTDGEVVSKVTRQLNLKI